MSPRSPGVNKHCHPQGRNQCLQGHQGSINTVTPGEDPVYPRSPGDTKPKTMNTVTPRGRGNVSKVTRGHYTLNTEHCHPQGRIQCHQGHQGTLHTVMVTPKGGHSVSKVTRGH
jgi:hypothetical protein